jgi:hypothetical protein
VALPPHLPSPTMAFVEFSELTLTFTLLQCFMSLATLLL